jgi:hypothetical protein
MEEKKRNFEISNIIAIILAIVALGGLFFGVIYLVEKLNSSQKETLKVMKGSYEKTFESIVSADNASKDRDKDLEISLVETNGRIDLVEKDVEKVKEEQEADEVKTEVKVLQEKISRMEKQQVRVVHQSQQVSQQVPGEKSGQQEAKKEVKKKTPEDSGELSLEEQLEKELEEMIVAKIKRQFSKSLE